MKTTNIRKDLFIQQEKHVIKWNQQIYDEYNDLSLLQASMNKESDTDLYHASELLCLASFRDFKDKMERSSEYSKQMVANKKVYSRSICYIPFHSEVCIWLKSLSKSDMKKIMDQILSGYGTREDKVKKKGQCHIDRIKVCKSFNSYNNKMDIF